MLVYVCNRKMVDSSYHNHKEWRSNIGYNDRSRQLLYIRINVWNCTLQKTFNNQSNEYLSFILALMCFYPRNNIMQLSTQSSATLLPQPSITIPLQLSATSPSTFILFEWQYNGSENYQRLRHLGLYYSLSSLRPTSFWLAS